MSSDSVLRGITPVYLKGNVAFQTPLIESEVVYICADLSVQVTSHALYRMREDKAKIEREERLKKQREERDRKRAQAKRQHRIEEDNNKELLEGRREYVLLMD